MEWMQPTPIDLEKEIDTIYQALRSASTLLTIGREYGLRVGISTGLAYEISKRYGSEAVSVIANFLEIKGS